VIRTIPNQELELGREVGCSDPLTSYIGDPHISSYFPTATTPRWSLRRQTRLPKASATKLSSRFLLTRHKKKNARRSYNGSKLMMEAEPAAATRSVRPRTIDRKVKLTKLSWRLLQAFDDSCGAPFLPPNAHGDHSIARHCDRCNSRKICWQYKLGSRCSQADDRGRSRRHWDLPLLARRVPLVESRPTTCAGKGLIQFDH